MCFQRSLPRYPAGRVNLTFYCFLVHYGSWQSAPGTDRHTVAGNCKGCHGFHPRSAQAACPSIKVGWFMACGKCRFEFWQVWRGKLRDFFTFSFQCSSLPGSSIKTGLPFSIMIPTCTLYSNSELISPLLKDKCSFMMQVKKYYGIPRTWLI